MKLLENIGRGRLVISKDDKTGSGCWLDNDSGELKCILQDSANPEIKFLVNASFDSNNELRITQIQPVGNHGLPSDLVAEAKKLITELVREKIPVEEL